MFSKNKKSLILLIIGFFWLSYVSLSAVLFYQQVDESTTSLIKDNQFYMQYAQDQIFGPLVVQNIEAVTDQLEVARKASLINFYILQKDKEVLAWYNNFNNLEEINVDYQVFNKVLANEKIAFKTLKVFNYRLTVGIFQDKTAIMKRTAWMMRSYIVRDIISVTAVLALIVFLVLRDILQLSKVLSGSDRSGIKSIKARSVEAEALINASKGLEGERLRLSNLSQTYSQTVGPAIVHEIQQGRPTPYQFPATICRVDLNGYTQLMLEKDPSYLNEILNTYFAMARETISRYGGLIYQFVGDEIVFEFKDDLSPDENSIALATACIRDLFAQAKTLENSLPESANHYFKLKASFAHGNMRFISLDEGHALSGIPLIESVRLLSTVEDKSNQILTFFEEDFNWNQDLVFIFDRKENHLKGFKESSKVCCTRDFRSIDWVFSSQSWNLLKYYRGDDDLIYALKKIRFYASSSELITLQEIFENLRIHQFEDVTPALLKEAEVSLFSFMELEKNRAISEKILCSYISLFQRLIPAKSRSKEGDRLLQKLLGHSNARVQANTVIAIGPSLRSAAELKKRIYSKNNRLAADALVELAKIQMDKSVYRAVVALLDHDLASHRKSGEYARAKILEHYQTEDPVFYESNPLLNSLKKQKLAS